MKKLIISLFLVLISVTVFAQNSAESANHNTALRCLKLAENCLVSGDYENALRQSELGLAYDESISDLLYVKATALSNLDNTKADVISVIAESFAKNNWVGYAKNGARILYADLLCDTGLYNESMTLLNEEPLIFSADAEYIRIKNFYRMGTQDALNNARLKVNSARRVYPADSRFPEIFFIFEYMLKTSSEIKGLPYEIPEIVQVIADSYISKLPDYSSKNENLEIYASFLANTEVRSRLVKAISAKSKKLTPNLVIAQKQIDMISDEQAFERFFNTIEDSVSAHELDLFVSSITEEEVLNKIIEKMTNWDGIIYFDEDLDLQNELSAKYTLGRPEYINFDSNNDGKKEIYATCDYGAPVSLFFINDNVELFYDAFPKVQKVNYVKDNYTFNFLHDDYIYSPFDMNYDKTLQSIGMDFYIPSIKEDFIIPTPYDLVLNASSVELPIQERDNAKVVYTVLNGKIVFANFYENETNYAYCDLYNGNPFVRYADYDNDGVFETSEIFDEIEEGHVLLDEEKSLMEKIFSKIIAGKSIYLKKVQIDRNSNTIIEFSEEYLSSGGRITTWDNDDNGIVDCQFIRYPAENGSATVEESIFYDTNGLPIVSLYSLDSVPLKMNYGQEEVMIYSGETENFFWIEEKLDGNEEKEILENVASGISQGVIELIQIKENSYSVIKIGNDYFCKRVKND